jgi:L-threonylcarbamoyladenylate synthase
MESTWKIERMCSQYSMRRRSSWLRRAKSVRIVRVDPENPDEKVVRNASAVLSTGGIVAYPTETFYGLAVDARSSSARERLFELKGRPDDKALPIVVSGIDQLETLADPLNPAERLLIETFWPGPLTLVVAARPGTGAAAPDGTIAVRASGLPLARSLASALGSPITATSANRSGSPPATTAEGVEQEFPGGIDLILDGGACPGGLPSTIVDARNREPRLLRQGRIPLEEILRALGNRSKP